MKKNSNILKMIYGKFISILKNKYFLYIILVLFIPYIFTRLFESYFYVKDVSFYRVQPQIIIIEYIFMLQLFLIILSLKNNIKKTTTIFSIIMVIFMFFEEIKIYYMQEPIVLNDIFLFSNTSELFHIIHSTLLNAIFNVMKYLSIIIIIVIIINMLIKHNSDLECSKKIRLSIFLISFLTILFLIFPPIQVKKFIYNKVFFIQETKDYARTTDMIELADKYGYIGSIYLNYLQLTDFKPLDYNESEVNRILNSNYEKEDNSFGKPNIIVLFAESFWDVDQLDEIDFNKQVTPNFTKLKDKGLFFNMISPSYGGASANVEFEFLTGANLKYYTQGYVPYMQLYNNDTYYNRISIIKDLKKSGYKTSINYFSTKNLYNCQRFYKYLNFDEVKSIDEFKNIKYKGDYVSDEYVVDQIIEKFDKKKKNEKMFYMTLSMQSHMPYTENKYKEYDISIENSKLSQEDNNMLRSYAQSIYDMDKELGRLYKYIQNYEEPTLLIFYGDHLPYLGYRENKMINLKYFNTEDELLNTYRKYNTQSLVLANFQIEENEYKYLSPDMLGTYVINRMDIEISPYYKWLYNSIDKDPSSNMYVSVDNNGKIYRTSEITGDLLNTYNTRRNIQYKLFVK